MVSIDKIQRGVAKYLDVEILPKLSGKDKWLLCGASTLYLAKLPQIITALNTKPAIKVLGLISDDGNVDIDALVNSIRPAAKQSNLNLQIPFSGVLSLSENDIDILLRYINQA